MSLLQFHYTTEFHPTFLFFSYSPLLFVFLVVLLPLVYQTQAQSSDQIRVSFWPKGITDLEDSMEDQREYVRSQGSVARGFEWVTDRLRGVETSVNTSTFGRVFRLGGCGHV